MRCTAKTQERKRCKNKAMPNARFCRLHKDRGGKQESPIQGLVFTDALYYPFIEIPNESWLKTVALYWNSISTIVPESITPYQSGVAKTLHDAGVLKPLVVNPDMPELEEVAEEVLDYLYTEEGRRALLTDEKEYYASIHSDKFWHELRHNLKRVARLHFCKMSPELSRTIQHMGKRRNRRNSWLHVPPTFAAYYMTLLATHLAMSKGRSLLTDNVATETLAARASLGAVSRLGNYPRVPTSVAEGVLATTVLSTIDIGPKTPVKKILSFRERHEVELAEFRSAVRDVVGAFSGPVTTEALSSHVESINRDKVIPAVENLRGKLRDHRITFGFNSLKATTLLSASPTALGVALSTFGLGPLALFGGVGLSVVLQTVNYRVQRREILRSSPFSYVLSAQKKFGSKKKRKR